MSDNKTTEKLKSEIKMDNKIIPDAEKDIKNFKSNLPNSKMKLNGK